MSKHTPEPWKMCRNDQSVGDARGYAVCDVWPRGDDQLASEEGKDNARRIVVCVNACAGVSNGELDMTTMSVVLARMNEAEQQRDELLAALEIIAASEEFHGDSFVCDFGTLQGVSRAAIAKAKGGEA